MLLGGNWLDWPLDLVRHYNDGLNSELYPTYVWLKILLPALLRYNLQLSLWNLLHVRSFSDCNGIKVPTTRQIVLMEHRTCGLPGQLLIRRRWQDLLR